MTRTDEQAKTFGPGTTCDGCSGAPLVRFRSESTDSEFFFCGHHANKNELALIASGYTIADDFREESHKFAKAGASPEGGSTLTTV